MRYPIAIETGTTAFGVRHPRFLPGCFPPQATPWMKPSTMPKPVATLWIDTALDAGQAIPKPSSVDTLRHQAAYAGSGCSAW